MTEALTDPTFPADVITPPVRKAVLDLVSGYLDMVGASVDVNQRQSLEPIISDGRVAGVGDGYMMLTVHIRVPPAVLDRLGPILDMKLIPDGYRYPRLPVLPKRVRDSG